MGRIMVDRETVSKHWATVLFLVVLVIAALTAHAGAADTGNGRFNPFLWISTNDALMKTSSAALVKIDSSHNIAEITWNVPKVETEYSMLLCSLYRLDRFGYPVVIAECDIMKPTGTYLIELDQVAKDIYEFVRSGDYYVKIRKSYLDERGEPGEIILYDSRYIQKITFDAMMKGEYKPVAVAVPK